jgi:hypothetical protein
MRMRMCSHVECVLYHTRSQKEGYTRTRMCSHIECVLYTPTLRLAMWHAWRARHVARLAGARGAPSNPLVGIENTFDRAQGGAKQSTCLSPSPNLAAPARRRAVHVRRVGPARGTCASHLCPSEDSGSQTDLLTPWYDRQAEIEHMRICSHVECVLYLRRAGRDRPFPVSADSRKVYSKQTQRTREHIENTFYMVAERDACA